MIGLVCLLLFASCTVGHAPISGYLVNPPEGTILFVYPKVLMAGGAIVVQTRLPRTLGATQCVSLITPEGFEDQMSCGVVEARRIVLTPTVAGRHLVRLELLLGDRLGVRREEAVCVVGGPESTECL